MLYNKTGNNLLNKKRNLVHKKPTKNSLKYKKKILYVTYLQRLKVYESQQIGN